MACFERDVRFIFFSGIELSSYVVTVKGLPEEDCTTYCVFRYVYETIKLYESTSVLPYESTFESTKVLPSTK